MFITMKELMLDVFQFVYKPQLLIADSAEAIANGFILAYVLVGELAGEFSRVICWVHVLRAVDHKLKPIQEPHRQLIRSDLLTIQVQATRATFGLVIRLFKEKWLSLHDRNIDAFIEYFEFWLTRVHLVKFFNS